MDIRILIKNGTVVDGSGAPAFAADVRVAGGRITELGRDLKAGTGERVIDAAGCYVTPGFIETHNHWDGGVWWSPNLEPLPAYGATRDELIAHLAEAGIGTSVHFIPVHQQPALVRMLGHDADRSLFPVAEALSEQYLSLPLYPDLLDRDVERVCVEVSRRRRGRVS